VAGELRILAGEASSRRHMLAHINDEQDDPAGFPRSWTIGALIVLFVASALAAGSYLFGYASSSAGDLRQCAGLALDAERLACYDAFARPSLTDPKKGSNAPAARSSSAASGSKWSMQRFVAIRQRVPRDADRAPRPALPRQVYIL
jgi:hypothetical protein